MNTPKDNQEYSNTGVDTSFTSISDESSPNFVTLRSRTGMSETLGPLHQEFQVFQDSILDRMEKWFAKQEAMISKVFTEFEEVKKSVTYMSNYFEELNNKTTSCINRVSDMEKRFVTLEQQAKQLYQLEAKIDSMEQQSRLCNIEISNIPERNNENLIKMLEDIGSIIKQTITSSDIVSLHRVPHADIRSSHPKNIIVKLASRTLRDNILSAARMTKGIYTDNLHISGERRKIFLNEHLTLKNKQLFRSAREMAKENNFRFVWIKHGSILVRESETSRVFAIRTSEDLCKIKPSK